MIGSSGLRVKIKKDRLAAAAVTLAPILYFITPILKGHVLCPDDGILQNVPFRVAAAQMIKAGFLPLWDPYIFSGMPLLAAAQPGILYPLNWFYLIFSPAAATNLMVVSSYMVAGLGAYLYARRIGTSIGGSVLTALVWCWQPCKSYRRSNCCATACAPPPRTISSFRFRCRGVSY
jgi:hypothetical protein